MEQTKNIKDYLHLYLGCECMIGDLNWKPETNLHGLAPGFDPDYGKPIRTKIDAHILDVFPHQTTLILRPLSDMTDEEQEEIEATKAFQRATAVHRVGVLVWTAESFRLLFSKGFDVFGLIEAGLAIDKTKL